MTPERIKEIRDRLERYASGTTDRLCFITHAPADMRELLDEVERLERENAELREALDAVLKHPGVSSVLNWTLHQEARAALRKEKE